MDVIMPLATACHYRPTSHDLIPIFWVNEATPLGGCLFRSHSQILLAIAVYIGNSPVGEGLPQKSRKPFGQQIQLCQLILDLLFGLLALIDIPIDAYPAFELAFGIPNRIGSRS